MNEVKTIEETLNGGYKGLYGEVVTCDTYRLKQVRFKPDIIFDVGANIGIFTRFARSLFPGSQIVALEPHLENIFYFNKHTPKDSRIALVKLALGNGVIYQCSGAANGAGESYLSVGLGYPEEEVKKAPNFKPVFIPSITLAELIDAWWCPGMKSILKVDCEGGENSIWFDSGSMQVLRAMDYIAFELHDYSLTGRDRAEVQAATSAGLRSLESTHVCERNGVNFWATKREVC